MDGAPRLTHRRCCARLRRRTLARRQRHRRERRRLSHYRGQTLSDRRQHFDGSDLRRRHRLGRWGRPPRRHRNTHRRDHAGRRGRCIGRHHRLRNPHPARPTLPSASIGAAKALSKWSRAHKTSSVKAAVLPRRDGPAAAKPAADGIRWSRKALQRRLGPRARAACSSSSRSKARPSKHRGFLPASPNSIA